MKENKEPAIDIQRAVAELKLRKHALDSKVFIHTISGITYTQPFAVCVDNADLKSPR